MVTLHVVFSGYLNDYLQGFYRSKYVVDGVEKYMATTQFESSDARMAFPCWDEPAVKARFRISLTTPLNYTAVSNMPAIKKTIVEKQGVKKTVSDLFVFLDFDKDVLCGLMGSCTSLRRPPSCQLI